MADASTATAASGGSASGATGRRRARRGRRAVAGPAPHLHPPPRRGGPPLGVTSLARSAADGGATLFTGGRDGTRRRWGGGKGALRGTVLAGARDAPAARGANGAPAAPDGGCAVPPASSTIPAAAATFDEHVDWVNDLAVLRYAGADRVASASSDGTVKVWHPDTGRAVRTLAAHSDYVMALALPSATSVASASLDGRVLLWDVEYGRVAVDLTGGRTKPGASLYCLAGVADVAPQAGGAAGGGGGAAVPPPDAGRVLVAGSRDRLVTVWDARAGARVAALRGHTDTVRAVAVAPGGLSLLSGSADTSVRVWDLRMQRAVHAVEAHADSVWALAVGGGGSWVLSGGRDGAVWRTWLGSSVSRCVLPAVGGGGPPTGCCHGPRQR
ncbi:hypothetical protein BU14_0378s0009 [Porphyra umbilicalis]|uniref:Uncharacterized protein n=1 Tax=Porphyra umbilicalis TaxID=2786 RepID=A0A1X6NWU2_PORUM|nr:hypothetical protein BU14_0378s0009 [Porphyra umbilicalis]|eukprot:OSX73099.1 hypothetical protein BU14_0378s0009 [Porphyra umbilicalis]